MKLIILKNNLIEGLNSVERAISAIANLPILKNILIKTEGGRISFTTTNLEIAITQTVSGKIVEEGEITVPLSIFAPVAKNLNSERISLEVKDKHMVVTTDNYEATIQTQSAKEFPIIPTISDSQNSISISSSKLLEALQSVIIATQYSEIRPEISGVFFKLFDQNLILAATDSFRLSERVIEANEVHTALSEVSMIVPFKTAEELTRFLQGDESDVQILIDQNQVLFKMANKQLISRLVDGAFPEYKAIIPKQIQNEAIINRAELINALKLASSFSGRANDVALKVGENKKFITLSSSDAAVGENTYRIPIKLKGEPFSVVFNWRYLLDGLKVYSSEDITLGVNASDRPAVIKNQIESSLTYVVMPIKN
jgi:DNA polymerase III subunit beta